MITTHEQAHAAIMKLSEQSAATWNDVAAFEQLAEAADLPPPCGIKQDGQMITLAWKGRSRHVTLAFGPDVTVDSVAALTWLRQGLSK